MFQQQQKKRRSIIACKLLEFKHMRRRRKSNYARVKQKYINHDKLQISTLIDTIPCCAVVCVVFE